MIKKCAVLQLKKNTNFLSNSKLQEKPSALREHPALQNMKFLLFSVFGGHFCSPGSGSSRPKPVRIHVDPDPYPQHWPKNSFSVAIHSNVPGTK
jgi:hypothetical protein